MNLENVVLVRAINYLPLNGELTPSFQANVLVDDNKSDFFYYIKNKVDKELEAQLGRPLNVFVNPEDKKMQDEMLKKYTVLTGPYYTTTLSFALNGLVPDDRHNTFSNLKIAVLDPIKNHMDKDFVSIDTIDTTIKGKINVSTDAVLLIDNLVYNSLPEDIKNNLNSFYNIKLFNGSLKEAVAGTLKQNNYPALPLVQSRELYDIELATFWLQKSVKQVE